MKDGKVKIYPVVGEKRYRGSSEETGGSDIRENKEKPWDRRA